MPSQFVQLLLAVPVVTIAHLAPSPPMKDRGLGGAVWGVAPSTQGVMAPNAVKLRQTDGARHAYARGESALPTCYSRHFTHFALLQRRVILECTGRARPPVPLLRVG
jgi:hypothetical protein